MVKLESPISLQNANEKRQDNQAHRLNSYLCRKKFILILITSVLVVVIVTVPIVLLQIKKAKNKLTTIIPTTTESTEEKEFVPLYNLSLTNTTKWRQDGITVLIDNYTEEDTIDIDDSDTLYICRCKDNKVEAWTNNFTEKRIVAGGNGNGLGTNQLSMPTDIVINRKNHSIIICDRGNRRVVQWSLQNTTNGNIILSNIYCRNLAIDDKEYLYISNDLEHEVRRWNMKTYENVLVAGGNGPGDDSTRLHKPRFIFVDNDYSVYVAEHLNSRVMKWAKDAKEGVLVAGGYGRGDLLIQIGNPTAIVVDHFGNLYVSDLRHQRIMRWINGASRGNIVVGGNGSGDKSNQVNNPIDFVFDKYGNMYVLSSYDPRRIQKFYIVPN